MPAAQPAQQRKYKSLAEIPPVEIWTPDFTYTAPRYIDREEMPVNLTYPQIVLEARVRKPSQRILTSGEWYQIREMLHKTDPELEKSMIKGNFERNSTLFDFTHGRRREDYYEGLLIQIPEMDDDGNILTDRGILEFDKEGNPIPESGIITAEDVFEMALPLESGYIKNLHQRFNPLIDTIYGMKGAKEKLPGYAYISIYSNGLRNLIRGHWYWRDCEHRRVDIDGEWELFSLRGDVAARAAAEEIKETNI
jgi:hypothetical protein